MVSNKKKVIVFGIGTGRCGTKFLSEVLRLEPTIASHHERHPFNDTFHRFCKWHDLPVDHAGFLETKRRAIAQDFERYCISYESSAYLSFSIDDLFQCFNAKFILLVRAPQKVVNSYVNKGWYKDTFYFSGKDGLFPSFQPDYGKFHHFLGRTLPKKEANYKEWSKLTQIGKLSWYWNMLNTNVLEQFKKLPTENKLIIKLENFDYEKYKEIAQFIGFFPKLTKRKFDRIVKSKPNAIRKKVKIVDWNAKEIDEFENQIRNGVAKEFGYHYQIEPI